MASSTIFLIFNLLLYIGITSLTKCRCQDTTKPKFPAILVFGDSTVDTGNNNFIVTLFKSDHVPYGQEFPNRIATGRFSNGKLVPDFLASEFGIKELVPPFLDPTLSDQELRTGVNFASAGSGLDDLTTLIPNVISVSSQITYFKNYKEKLEKVAGKEEATKIINGAFVLISAGSNDLLFNYYDTPTRHSQYNISRYHDFLLQNLHGVVKQLYDLGCRTFALAGLAPIGCVPIQLSAKFKFLTERTCLEDENKDTLSYNAKLDNLSKTLQASLPGSTFKYINLYDTIFDMIKNPKKYGFVETNRGCCGTGLVEMGPLCNAETPVCSNSSEYLFWDAVHPSEAVYKLVTKNISGAFSS